MKQIFATHAEKPLIYPSAHIDNFRLITSISTLDDYWCSKNRNIQNQSDWNDTSSKRETYDVSEYVVMKPYEFEFPGISKISSN